MYFLGFALSNFSYNSKVMNFESNYYENINRFPSEEPSIVGSMIIKLLPIFLSSGLGSYAYLTFDSILT